MTEALVIPKPVSEAEYLEAEESAAIRHEFVDGTVFAMAGGTRRHNELVGELFLILRSHLPSGCQVYQLEMKLKLLKEKSRKYYYPDLIIACDSKDSSALFVEKPLLLIEILSLTTERTDRIEKLAAYSQIASLQEYLLVSQDVPKIEVFRRSEGWRREEFYREHTISLSSIDLDLAMQDLYQRVGLLP